jgi:hypothetical protein
MKTLREIYEEHNGRLLNKWEHYIEIYDQYFHKYRNKEFVFLEIGIAHGGSLEMWRTYFGEEALIIGVDVNPECKKFETGNTRVFIGSQEDKVFLEELKASIPKIDILLDDGGHTMTQQIVSFNMMFDHVNENGIYACEDLHTSYWPKYGGGLKKKNTFIEFSKNFIDNIHGWHATGNEKRKIFNKLTESIYGLHYYDSILLIEKKPIIAPVATYKGVKQLSHHFTHYGIKIKLTEKIKHKIKSWLK